MKIVIQTDSSVQETTLNIRCREITPELERLISVFRLSDKKISAKAQMSKRDFQFVAQRAGTPKTKSRLS